MSQLFSRRSALTAAAAMATAAAVPAHAAATTPAGPLLPTGKQLRISSGRQSLVVAEVGAALRSWTVDGRELLLSHAADSMGDSHLGKILLPWVDRIDGGKYTFGGAKHETPISEHWNNCAIHGLMGFLPWRVTRHERDRLVLSYLLHPQYGYPFTLRFQVEYVLSRAGLRVSVTATNAGRTAAPLSSGYHPYFRVSPTIDSATLMLAADTRLTLNDRLIPTGRAPVAGTPEDYRTPKLIGATKIDACYTDLLRPRHDTAVAALTSPEGHTIELWVDDSHKFLLVYTDEYPEGRPPRTGIAIEPVTSAPNAFNSGDGLIVLEPGKSYTGFWGVRTNLL
ncbi:aldose 1-epimerase family protein [Lentzea sp. NPDC006480]|uniref:aldose 1-epimerase family protein n=1 Tax=Lentzea sp. NPDC006480 TaxID=3157176 RepID=UPI0033BF5111